jgi:hypothetical protein
METGCRAELAIFGHKPAYFSDFRQKRLSAESPRKTPQDPGAGVATPGWTTAIVNATEAPVAAKVVTGACRTMEPGLKSLAVNEPLAL